MEFPSLMAFGVLKVLKKTLGNNGLGLLVVSQFSPLRVFTEFHKEK